MDRGERGPKGDHGQHGDGGVQGERGLQGIQGDPGQDSFTPKQITRSFVAMCVVFFLIILILAWNIQRNRQLIRDGREAKAALCTFRADLQRRVADTEDFVASVKAGNRPPIQGISVADLERSLSGQRSTLAALKLDCP